MNRDCTGRAPLMPLKYEPRARERAVHARLGSRLRRVKLVQPPDEELVLVQFLTRIVLSSTGSFSGSFLLREAAGERAESRRARANVSRGLPSSRVPVRSFRVSE